MANAKTAKKTTTPATPDAPDAPRTNVPDVMFCVLAHGWVFVGRVQDNSEQSLTLVDACVIRRWGTKRGIGQIRNSPTNETILDPIEGEMRVERSGILFSWASGNHAVWNRFLDKALEGPIEKSSG